VGLCSAYAAQMNDHAFFNSVTAALVMNFPLPPRLSATKTIHVAVPSPHRGLEGTRVIGHKVKLMGDDWRLIGDLRVSSPTRVWCELAVLLSVPELVAVGDFIIHWRLPLASIEQLADAARRYPDRRGRVARGIAIGLLNNRAESPKESELRTILVVGGVRGVEVNVEVSVGMANYRLDLAIPALKIDIEYQGDYHRDQAQWRRDMTRRSRLESDGWRVIDVNEDDLHDPAELVARVQRIIRSHPATPR
jgi:very-short-patch-repair endonuclease